MKLETSEKKLLKNGMSFSLLFLLIVVDRMADFLVDGRGDQRVGEGG